MLYFREIAHAIRRLRHTGGFSAIVIIILAVGIAANTIIFSVINAAMLRPLPYPNSAQLVVLNWHSPGKLISPDISARAFFLLREQAHSFESLAAMANLDGGVNLSGAGKPQYVRGFRVSASFFRTLGILPLFGRSFSPEEERPGGPHAVVLSHDLWAQHFDKDPAAIGKQIRIDGELRTVVGIMPEYFRSYPEADLWLPLPLHPASADPGNEYRVIGRLKDGVTKEDAQRELDLSPGYRLTYPLQFPPNEVRLGVDGLQSAMAFNVRKSLALLFAASLFLLLITCMNLAVLLTVRAAGRIREVAIRLALGASRACLIRMPLIEGSIFGVLGGLLGIVLAKEAIPFVLSLARANDSFTYSVTIDRTVVTFTALVSVLTVFTFGLASALKMSRTNLNELLRQTSSNATSGLQHTRLSWVLVSAQAACTVFLLTGAGLLLRSFSEMYSVSPGFDSRHLWVAQFSLASKRYKTASSSAELLEQLCEKIQANPGVEGAASVTGLPLERGLNLILFPANQPEKTVYAEYRIIAPEYFDAMRIRMIAGRSFFAGDSHQNMPVAIVNETLAKLWWPQESSLGHYVSVESTMGGMFSDLTREIVGVAADV